MLRRRGKARGDGAPPLAQVQPETPDHGTDLLEPFTLMTTSRSISRVTALESNQPAPGFDKNTQLNSTSLGADIGPFVDLSEFEMSQPVFRPHPHAGFSVVTYMFEDSPGTFRNRWSMGEEVTIPPGALHWTQAGAGMMHEEIPIEPDEVVEITPADGVRTRLLAGTLGDASAGLAVRHDLTFAEVHLDPDATVELPAPLEANAFVFVQRGAVEADAKRIDAGSAAAFAPDGDHVSLVARHQTSLLFGTGVPLETDAHVGGPFIMSTPERLDDAYAAYRRGDMGQLEPSF